MRIECKRKNTLKSCYPQLFNVFNRGYAKSTSINSSYILAYPFQIVNCQFDEF